MYMWFYFMVFAAIGLVICLLYRRGFVVSKRITAVLFVFHPSKNGNKMTLNSCTGWVRHPVRFHTREKYIFTFRAELSAGRVAVILLDKQKPLLKLDQQSPICELELNVKSRYYLRWEMEHCTGTCELQWQNLLS